MTPPETPSPPPTPGNALVGALGIGARVMASATLGAAAAARAATRPAAAIVHTGMSTPPGQAARAEARSLLESLDAAGRRDIERAKAEVNLALDRAVDRVTTDTISSERTSRAIERLLDSEDLWRLVDRIAKSPEVVNAIASASAGLTGVVADEARRRTVTADEFAERVARRVLRRAPREPQAILIEPVPAEGAAPKP